MTRGKLPRWVDYGLIPVMNLAAAFLVAGLVVLLIGENPLEAVRILIYGSLGFGEGIGFTLFYATNFIFTGLAVAVAFHAGLFNIGGEGQAYVGGLGVGLACLALDRFVPWWVTFPVAVAGGAVFGAAWALVPAYLQARRGSHVVITTIMFNFIASSLMVYLLVNVLAKPGSMQPETRNFEAGGQLPLIRDLLPGLDLGQAPLNLAFVLALAACLFVWVLIWRSRLGYEIRTFGANQSAAIYAGISPVRITIVTMLISGGLAGLMAINEVMGSQTRLLLEFTAGYGFVGIAVALMGRAHPVGIILASILFGMLYQGGAELAFEKPAITRDMIVVIQGLVILFAGALEHLFRPWLERLFASGHVPEAQAA
ncbi:nucleoside ABC transporter membrane protein [Breoghania corrubedonensis]|uniref:Nucleoside ABC transporter membrane protein n=1 Tax=Breoghania corrubedonensis TaxID=665038 RepID=A0A2T5VFH5_9HYPH|nr:ABC transporter permease [Breoghania corrubedonensis]PTW62507.1 nucleoside ABC transporter membrane protein [Breoghania corrubedonensis]